VDDISPQADRQKGTVQAKVRVLDPDDGMRTEVNARVTFLGDAPDTASGAAGEPRLWIPKAAVVQGTEGTTVYTVEGTTAASVRVKLGTEAEKGVEVVEGLTGDEMLIVSPLEKLAPGAHVVAAQK
jgi:HlyD family secretion protein